MKGLKPYSHADRQKVIEEMIPLVQKKFGDNLIAFAAQASFARNQDGDYSDLELIAFLKRMPGQEEPLGLWPSGHWGGMGKIRDGLLVEFLWTTREAYLQAVKEVTENWYLAGSDKLLPVLNEQFINELNDCQVENLKQKCFAQAANHWHEVQESAAKVLNAIGTANREGLPLVVFDMLRHVLITLSFLNQIPYVTFAQFITQARTFQVKPAAFTALADIVVRGQYQDLPVLREAVTAVFTELETILEGLGFSLYEDNVDPNKPAKRFV